MMSCCSRSVINEPKVAGPAVGFKCSRLFLRLDFLGGHVVIHDRQAKFQLHFFVGEVLLCTGEDDRHALTEMSEAAPGVAALQEFFMARAHGRNDDTAEELCRLGRGAQLDLAFEESSDL
jgi:hypothetical protein